MEKPPTAYLGIKYHEDNSNKTLVENITAAFGKAEMRVVCVARDIENWGRITFSAKDLMRESLGAIREADVVVVEASEKGVGLGIEAGYAYAYRLPLIAIHTQETEVSKTLRGIATRVIAYDGVEALERAARQVRRVLTRPAG